MSDYTKYQTKTASKLRQRGGPITVRRAGKKVYDPKTNTYIDTGKEFSGYAVQKSFSIKNVDGTNIRFGDVLLMASLDERPLSNDTVNFGGRSYTVIDVQPLNPDGRTDIFYNIHAR